MKILRYVDVREGDGWLHALLVEVDNGVQLCIVDDTDGVSVTASTAEPVSALTVVAIWREYAMGCSHFPAKPIDESLRCQECPCLPHVVVEEMGGAEFSRMARYTVYETVAYEVEAPSADDAIEVIVQSPDRDKYSVSVSERWAANADDPDDASEGD